MTNHSTPNQIIAYFFLGFRGGQPLQDAGYSDAVDAIEAHKPESDPRVSLVFMAGYALAIRHQNTAPRGGRSVTWEIANLVRMACGALLACVLTGDDAAKLERIADQYTREIRAEIQKLG